MEEGRERVSVVVGGFWYIYKQEHQVVRGVDNQLELWLMVAWSKGCSGEGGNVFFWLQTSSLDTKYSHTI